jgi:hypothetical protein
LSVGVIATALLLSGGLVGVSVAGGQGIEQPEVIELSLDVCGAKCKGYALRDPIFGQGNGFMTLSRDPVFDVDGNKVGNQDESCVVSKGTAFVCSYVITLKDGQHTQAGTVVTTGIYLFDDPTTFAVTGGTGAYANVRGYAALETSGGQEFLTLNLIP